MTEAYEGQLAENQATRADVKKTSQRRSFKTTPSPTGVSTSWPPKPAFPFPRELTQPRTRTIEQLVSLKDQRFDRTFIRDEIAAHRHAITLFKREAKHGQQADVKAYAAKMIPVLEKHLHLAEECAKPTRRS
jgi:putative membrane protein